MPPAGARTAPGRGAPLRDASQYPSLYSAPSLGSASSSTAGEDETYAERCDAFSPLGEPTAEVGDAFARLEREALRQPSNAFARLEREAFRKPGAGAEADLSALRRSVQQLHADARTHVRLELEAQSGLAELRGKIDDLQQVGGCALSCQGQTMSSSCAIVHCE